MEIAAIILLGIYDLVLIADIIAGVRLEKEKREYNVLQREQIEQLEKDREIFIKVAGLNCNIWNALSKKMEDKEGQR